MSGVHPDKTAAQAVDACGGTYSSSLMEARPGYAKGHRDALIEAVEAVKSADALTAELLSALQMMIAIVSDSDGVAGYHLNGDLAKWDEFDEVAFANAVIAKAKNGDLDRFYGSGWTAMCADAAAWVKPDHLKRLADPKDPQESVHVWAEPPSPEFVPLFTKGPTKYDLSKDPACPTRGDGFALHEQERHDG